MTALQAHRPQTQSKRSDKIVIQTRSISKTYGSQVAVDQLSLNIHQGDIFGFLGPNGAGKTTTIRMILGLITPTNGDALILGQQIPQERAVVLPRVGALIEQPALYGYLSGRDNLRAIGSVLGNIEERRIDAVLEVVGLKSRQKDRVRTYSLGMKQRLGVAIALLQDPEILILDEPANGLDPAGIVEMRDLLRNLVANGKTIFISSHVLNEVQQICSQVAILNKGKLVTEASIEELLAGTGEYLVSIEPAYLQEAIHLLQQQPWGRNARIVENEIITAAPGGQGRDLNIFLVQSGFAPFSFGPMNQDLEQVFLRLTEKVS
jgi:ABC-2 type transport system ATP-binding protein